MNATPLPSNAPSMRPLAGLVGIFIAAMTVGLNNRVGALALSDVRGALGLALDDASWLTTVYSAGELMVMPFSIWFAITLSVRRFALWILGLCMAAALILPWVRNLESLLLLRFAQGAAGSALIPVLMMMGLRFLPPPIRLHGLALFSMTATFSPNLALWLAAQWTDALFDWRWVYWQIIPLLSLAGLLVGWGLPHDSIQYERFRHGNWFGMACGMSSLGLLAVVADQWLRLDGLNSPLIAFLSMTGLAALLVYLLSEWFHPEPFIKLQILNGHFGLGFAMLMLLLMVAQSGSLLPVNYLARIQDYRALQSAPIGLIVGLPQLALAPLVASLLYRQWVDARIVFSLGLALMALACLQGSRLDSGWLWEQFVDAQILHALGQPMAIVSLLFLMTSVVPPRDGPYIAGFVNTLRASGILCGGTLIGQYVTRQGRVHDMMLLDHAALAGNALPMPEPAQLAGIVSQQAFVLATADAYRLLGLLALLLVPLALCLRYVPAPDSGVPPSSPDSSHGQAS
ncbi:MAG: MFS transporter [Zoogloeaceae bacterium]|jgi:DHA2 family multidrug resistance protein|nr:MFS transporter [Zoogloeaceae bacterium]